MIPEIFYFFVFFVFFVDKINSYLFVEEIKR